MVCVEQQVIGFRHSAEPKSFEIYDATQLLVTAEGGGLTIRENEIDLRFACLNAYGVEGTRTCTNGGGLMFNYHDATGDFVYVRGTGYAIVPTDPATISVGRCSDSQD